MALKRLAIAVLGLLASCAGPEGSGCHIARVASLPFQLTKDGLIVQAQINGAPASLIFDTGSSSSVLTRAAVARLHLPVSYSDAGRAYGIGGSRQMDVVTTRSFDLGVLHGVGIDLFRADIFAGENDPPDGLLSSDVLSKYDIDIDYPGRRIQLFYAEGDCREPQAALAPPLYTAPLMRDMSPTDRNPTPRIRVAIGAQSLVADLDTGAETTMIWRGVARSHGIDTDTLFSARSMRSVGAGPKSVRSEEHIFEPLTVGEITVSNLPITILDQGRMDSDDMLLGEDFLSRVHLWISNSSGTLIMQYPPQRSPEPIDDKPTP